MSKFMCYCKSFPSFNIIFIYNNNISSITFFLYKTR
nr:MAG TPA: hypothetical protein [Caudoviricetes sp.]